MRSFLAAVVLFACCLLATPLYAVQEDANLKRVRTFLHQGFYDKAIETARYLLKQPNISDTTRFHLLQAIADAEAFRAAQRNYEHVDTAVRAFQDLIKEFPSKVDHARTLWRIAQLYWHHQNMDKADTAIRLLLKQHPHAAVARKAALLHARIMIAKGNYAEARSTLLLHYGLGTSVSDKEEAEGLAWLAIVDHAEGKNKLAFQTLKKTYQRFPAIIENNATLYATFITLLFERREDQAVMLHAQRFLKHHVPSREAPGVQLALADVLARQGKLQKAADLYGILADRYKYFSVGKKARIRQLVIEHRASSTVADIKSAISELSAIAAEAQLSDIEAEAQLNWARMLLRLEKLEQGHVDEAIGLYALAAASEHKQFAAAARREGRRLVRERIEALLADEQWLAAVVLWKRYPQLKPASDDMLAFGIARAYMQLMDFDRAEEILDQLYARNKGTVLGQRIMLQKARLWLERGDADGVAKIMRWLTAHEYTLYRQDMLLMAAEMQSRQGDYAAARQTLTNVSPADLAPELRRDYWRTSARVSSALKRWHAAASAWRHLSELTAGSERADSLKAEAEALIAGTDYAAAEKALRQVAEDARDERWQFAMALCLLHTGRHKLAQDYLTRLAAGQSESAYRIRARLMLAEQKAEQLAKVER